MKRTIACLALVAALSPAALAQGGTAPTTSVTPAAAAKPAARSAPVARPAWSDLTAAQREALAPLHEDWDSFERDRKRKWLEVATKYPRMTPEAQQHLHERMVEFVRLTPQQRRTARENFKKAYELPLEQRQQRVDQFKALPPERRQELANQAAEQAVARKGEPPRRAARDARTEATKPNLTPQAVSSAPAKSAPLSAVGPADGSAAR
jgi:hypothetical protein